jgi:DNA repair exonuclease SbcCD ATPase subunit
MKIEFSHIEITNFLSYGNNKTVVDLKSNKPILILGKNYVSSSDGSDSNGAGKSSILNAISFCLYDTVLSNINKDKLINNINKKDMVVTLFLSVNDIKYKIQRYRKNKVLGGDGVRIFKDGDENWNFTKENDCTPDSTANTNKYIEKLLGKSYDIFSRIVVFSATSQPFLSLSSPDQIQFLEELFGYSEVSERAEQIKESMKSFKQNLEKEIAVNDTIKNEIERIQNQITHLNQMRDNWNTKQSQIIKENKSKLNEVSKIDLPKQKDLLARIKNIIDENSALEKQIIDAENRITQVQENNKKYNSWEDSNKEQISKLQEELSKISNINFDEIQSNLEEISELETYLKTVSSQIDQLNRNIIDKNKNITKLQKEVDSLKNNKCPYCEQGFKDSLHKHDVVENLLKDEKINVTKLESELSEVIDIQKDINSEINKKKKLCSTWTLSSLNSTKNSIVNLNDKIKLLTDSKNPYELKNIEGFDPDIKNQNTLVINENIKKISELQSKCKFSRIEEIIKIESEINYIVKRLDELENEINPYDEPILELMGDSNIPETRDSQIDELQKIIKHQDFLIKLLTKKDSFVRKHLLQKNLPLLNSRLKLYLTKMGLPHKVTFIENMSAEIKQFDTVLEFNQLSSGQKARINLALSFAFRDVLQYRHGFVNFCMLDECLDVGLSNTGVQLAVKFIKEVAREQNLSLFIISHRDEATSMFDKKLMIEYKNGFSNIIST